jgi:hypothetical protein
MVLTESPCELELPIAPEFGIPDDPAFDSQEEGADTAVTQAQVDQSNPSLHEGALGLRADAGRKQYDDDDDSDLVFDDSDYDDDVDEDKDLDDDLDDDEDAAEDFDDEIDDHEDDEA